MIKLYFKAIVWMIKVSLQILVLLYPTLMIYGSFNEWPIAKEKLDTEQNQSLLLIGVSGNEHDEYMQKSYLLVPRIFTEPKIHTVTKYKDGNIEIESSHIGFWFLIICYLAICIGTYLFWIKKWISHYNTFDSQPSVASTPKSGTNELKR